MREEILVLSAISSIDTACGPCPKSGSKKVCAFGFSAIKVSELKLNPKVQAEIIIYDFLENDQTEDCSNQTQVQAAIKDLRKVIK